MTLPSENNPTSLAAADRQRQSRMEDGPRSGPNKEGASAPHGAGVLGTEMGAEADARRERAQALAEGEQLPSEPVVQVSGYAGGVQGNDYATNNAGNLGFGQKTGEERGFSNLPSQGERQENQGTRNESWQSGQPDLASIARSSNAQADHNPTQPQEGIKGSASRRPEELLDTAGRSLGTESGAGAYAGGVLNQGNTANVPDQ